jgi:hypothetical protein
MTQESYCIPIADSFPEEMLKLQTLRIDSIQITRRTVTKRRHINPFTPLRRAKTPRSNHHDKT